MQKGRKLFISFCLTVIALFSVITATFAYFNISNIGDISGDINVNITIDNNVEVNDFASLYVACKNDTYNDSNVVSSTSNRKTIKFMDDITLINDLFVSADVHINLNNHTLNYLFFYFYFSFFFSFIFRRRTMHLRYYIFPCFKYQRKVQFQFFMIT